MTSDFLDVTPHARILGVLGELELPQWACLAELSDNGFDELIAAGSAVADPTVSITLPNDSDRRAVAQVVVNDNGRGMTLDQLGRAVRAGWSGNDRFGALGMYGMGFNIASARFGHRATVRTSQAGDLDWIEVTIDQRRLSANENYHAPYTRSPKRDINEHGTTVTISDLKQDQFDFLRRKANHAKLRERLGDIYSTLLSEKGFSLYINGVKVPPRLPCVWNHDRTVLRSGAVIKAYEEIDVPLPSRMACADCGFWNHMDVEACVSCDGTDLSPRERRIKGWIGIQRYFHKTDYGIDFIRNGRKILTRDKRVFEWRDDDGMGEPELEYPIDAKTPVGRIVGEIHCDHIAPNFTKTAFAFDSPDWFRVIREIRGTSPLRPQIARRLELPPNESKLANLYAGFRRQDPGLNYLVPGDGRVALHDKAREWADQFRAGNVLYQDDRVWYEAARQHDNPISTSEHETGDDEIIPGIALSGDDGEGEPAAEEAPEPQYGAPPVEETIEQRLARYRENATKLVDLSARYDHPDLGGVDLTAWAVRGTVLVDARGNEAPVVVQMIRAPHAEVFVNADHQLVSGYGVDLRDIALIEVSEWMRVRAARTDIPLTEVFSGLKARSGAQRLTPSAIADEAERLLERLRSAMLAPVATDAEVFASLMTSTERVSAEKRFAVESSAGSWSLAMSSGDFVLYAPATALIRMIVHNPAVFLDGVVFNRSFGSLSETPRTVVIDRLVGLIGDLALLEEHRPRLDADELARLRISCRLVARDLVEPV
ncbi:hypothetical protein ABIA35_004202 [Catenulispora sp. MAP12-49]|uniref:ATP-binding protein n=1 Tax=Catenulispora sp. MAP12-49 TaxID=3156302 RepID=UPI003515060B